MFSAPSIRFLARAQRSLALGLLLVMGLRVTVSAQTAITSLQTTTTDAGDTSGNGISYRNTTVAVNGFTGANSSTYTISQTVSNVYVRRDTTAGNPDNTSIWYQDDAGSGYVTGTRHSTDPGMLNDNNLYQGVDDVFGNAGTTATEKLTDVERLDFVFRTGVTVASTDGFALFERGPVNQHDGFVIAAITGFNTTTNQATSFSAPLTISAANYGTSNLTSSFTADVYRYGAGDNINSTAVATDTASGQGIGGVFVSMSDLGIANGTTIYGYVIMATDVTTTNSANLVDWTNATYYPTNTDRTATGGLDLTGVNGLLYRVVPEPSTYGAIFSALFLGVFGVCRRRARRSRAE